MERYIKKQILADLKEKMVLLAGPRQVGKTTLSKLLVKNCDYMNWDIDEDRSRILAKEFQRSSLWVFDEIHKYKKWRNYLKGLVDKFQADQKILVTGSARLDILRKGGDSLQGRYHFLRLMPLTVNELGLSNIQDVLDLYELSGFPEPYFKASKVGCNRWSRSYRERIVRQEVASNELFQDLATVEIVFQRLPALVGGLFSANSLSEDVQVDQKTLVKWVNALERLYAIFKVAPFGPPKIKAVKKAQKIFFYDWNAIIEPGHRFENFVAVHLLKWVYFEQDVQGRDLDLRFFRDKYNHEVDFVIMDNGKPLMFIETKLTDQEASMGLRYLKSKYKDVRALQLHIRGKKDFVDGNGIEHCHCFKLLKELV
ncbi:MAG: ATP-binding protein [Bdellovibrionaceae bacterium]|nr:ATP-binding protein [Pseudobdellovibrionaceae bacterium]